MLTISPRQPVRQRKTVLRSAALVCAVAFPTLSGLAQMRGPQPYAGERANTAQQGGAGQAAYRQPQAREMRGGVQDGRSSAGSYGDAQHGNHAAQPSPYQQQRDYHPMPADRYQGTGGYGPRGSGYAPQNGPAQPNRYAHPNGYVQQNGYRPLTRYGPQNAYPQQGGPVPQNNPAAQGGYGRQPNGYPQYGLGQTGAPQNYGQRQTNPGTPNYPSRQPNGNGGGNAAQRFWRAQPDNAGANAARGEHLQQWMERHNQLNTQDQQRALSHEPGFNQLPQQTQQRMLDRLQRLNSMPAPQRERVLERSEQMERLSPDQRREVRSAMGQLGALPQERRRAVARSFRELRPLSPQQRSQFLNSPAYRQQFSDEERGTLGNLLNVSPMLPQQ